MRPSRCQGSTSIAAAWLLPSLGLTLATLALGTWLRPLVAAASVGLVWAAFAAAAAVSTHDRLAAFHPAAQVACLVAIATSAAVLANFRSIARDRKINTFATPRFQVPKAQGEKRDLPQHRISQSSRSGPVRPFGVTICAVNMRAVSSGTPLLCTASALLLAAGLGMARFAYSQEVQGLELLHVRGNVSMLAGAGGNITVQAGRDGILLVDAGSPTMTEKVLQAIRTVSRGQVTYIVNTTDRSDHVGGNANFAKIGRPLAIARAAQARVFIIGFSTMLDRMSDPSAKRAVPVEALAERHLFGAAEEPVVQRRGNPDLSSAGNDRRRQHRPVPARRRRQRRETFSIRRNTPSST